MHIKLDPLFLPINKTESRDAGAQEVKLGYFKIKKNSE
jgi:hypothetical protein